MTSRFIGGILLIVGTSIGGGMLALPIANAAVGFWLSSFILFLSWSVMTLGALFILEANLYLPPQTHMVSMAASTLGAPGLITAWLSYLFLLYTLLSAYIAGGADVLGGLINQTGWALSTWQASLLFTLLFGSIVYAGIRQVDWLNRLLMFGKLAVYILLVVFIAPHVQEQYVAGGNMHFSGNTLMILITSFGFAIIVPNLRDYFNDDIVKLRKVILIGSIIPLICYIFWDLVIMGSIPTQEPQGLATLMNKEHPTSALAALLSDVIQNTFITSAFNFFTSICMLTAFLGVSLCLMSFLADGIKITQKGFPGIGLFILTFLPPLILVIYYPGAYIHALQYAGYFCVILLLLLPTLMTVAGRKKFKPLYQVPGGIFSQWFVIIVSLGLLLQAFLN